MFAIVDGVPKYYVRIMLYLPINNVCNGRLYDGFLRIQGRKY